MELHKALRNIIQTEGREIVKDIRIINILDDFSAYKDIPASKYILRAIIADGYAEKILKVNDWNGIHILIQKFTSTTGFVIDSVDLIFQSIAYGLGLIEVITKSKLIESNNSSISQSNSIWSSKMSNDDKENYILGLIDFNHEGESENGYIAQNISCEVESNNEFTFYLELKKTKNTDSGATLRMTIYDLNGKIRKREILAVVVGGYNNVTLTTHECYIDFPINKISKLYLYWD